VREAEGRGSEGADLRGRLAGEIVRRYPGCSRQRAEAIARRTATRGSGRVGRSAAGRSLDPAAVEAAVLASVRHEDTVYDDLLMGGVERAEARDRVRGEVERVLERWRSPLTRRTQ
jgi:hypothetical protein